MGGLTCNRSQVKQTQWKSISEENGAGEIPGRFRVLAAFGEVLSSIPSTHVEWLTSTVTPDPGNLTPSSGLHRYLQACGHTHWHTQTNRNKISLRLKMDWSLRFIAVSPSQSSDITSLLHCVSLCLKMDWSLPFIAVLPHSSDITSLLCWISIHSDHFLKICNHSVACLLSLCSRFIYLKKEENWWHKNQLSSHILERSPKLKFI